MVETLKTLGELPVILEEAIESTSNEKCKTLKDHNM